MAGDALADNLNPVGRIYYVLHAPVRTQRAVPSGGYSLGAQAGEAAIRQVVTDAGFTRSAVPPKPRSTSSSRRAADGTADDR